MRWSNKELRDSVDSVGIPATVIEARWAWAAGLFDGEGCIVIYDKQTVRGTQYKRVFLQVNMTDQDVVEAFAAQVRGPGLQTKQPSRNRKQQYVCALHNEILVERALRGMLPYLGYRRSEKAWEALAVIEENRNAGSRRFT